MTLTDYAKAYTYLRSIVSWFSSTPSFPIVLILILPLWTIPGFFPGRRAYPGTSADHSIYREDAGLIRGAGDLDDTGGGELRGVFPGVRLRSLMNIEISVFLMLLPSSARIFTDASSVTTYSRPSPAI